MVTEVSTNKKSNMIAGPASVALFISQTLLFLAFYSLILNSIVYHSVYAATAQPTVNPPLTASSAYSDSFIQGAFINETAYDAFLTKRLADYHNRMVTISSHVAQIITLSKHELIQNKITALNSKLSASRLSLDLLGLYTATKIDGQTITLPTNSFGKTLTFEEQRKIVREQLDDAYALLSVILGDVKVLISSDF